MDNADQDMLSVDIPATYSDSEQTGSPTGAALEEAVDTVNIVAMDATKGKEDGSYKDGWMP